VILVHACLASRSRLRGIRFQSCLGGGGGGGGFRFSFMPVWHRIIFFKHVGHIDQAGVAYDSRFLIHACVCWRS
jgi:hypothetical protein